MNREFWRRKIDSNCMRDQTNMAELEKLGLRPLTIWACETSSKRKLATLQDHLTTFLASS
jgi:G:T-mismatch repair DNA endonuclease (very short patch repair protein)